MFVDTSRDMATLSGINNSVSAPFAMSTQLAIPIGPQARLVLRWSQGATAGLCTIGISVGVVARTA